MYPQRRPLTVACAALVSVLAVTLLPGCGTHRSNSPASFAKTPDKFDLATIDAGAILITAETNVAEITADAPARLVQPISEGAADATRSFLNTPSLGNPQLETAVGAIQFALAPFAAAYGAIGASQKRLSPGELDQVQVALSRSMISNAAPELLAQKVADVARQKTRRTLLCTCDGSNATDQTPVSAVLSLAVNQLGLKAVKPHGNQYRLSIEASARLIRTSDRAVVLQKSYRYESGADLFIDWTRNRGLEDVARTGYQNLAEQITEDVFQPVSQPPILIGPGRKPSNAPPDRALFYHERLRTTQPSYARSSEVHRPDSFEKRCQGLRHSQLHTILYAPGRAHYRLARQVRERGERPPPQGVTSTTIDSSQEETGSMEVHTGRTDDRFRIPAQTTPGGNDSGNVSDTKWSMDGLEFDHNAVVQGMACLAAVPFGLWEQTVGVVQSHSREKKDELVRTLRSVTTQEHFEGDLADAVARHLQESVADPIRRTDEPMRFAFMDQKTGPAASKTNSATPFKTALELQVISTRFIGKHPNSSSRSVMIEVQATVYRTSDGQELYSRPIRYQSAAKRLKDWAASDAQQFRRELNECSRQTAQALVNDLVARGLVTPNGGNR